MKKTFLLYFAKIPILPQFRLVRTFVNSNKNVFPLRVQISGCVLYSETKKVKQLHSKIPSLKHELLPSDSAIRKLIYKKKQLKTEQPLNQTFSPEKI